MMHRQRIEKAEKREDVNNTQRIIPGCHCPSKCFCKFDASALVEIAYKKYILGVPTVDLIHQATTSAEKDNVSVVALLDLDQNVRSIMISEQMSGIGCDVISCRDGLRRRLDKALADYVKRKRSAGNIPKEDGGDERM